MRRLTVLILLVINAIYILAGAFIFSAIESSDDGAQQTVDDMTQTFIGNRSCVPRFEIESFVRTVSQKIKHGIPGVNQTVLFQDWSFPSSMLFTITAVTTIGYGHVAPVTAHGRAFCVLFLIVGIPLMASLLAGIGGNISKTIRARRNGTIWVERNRKVDLLLKFVTVHVLMTSAMICVPAAIFSNVEGWTYGEAIYYVITTLTTVGFGDFYIAPKRSGSVGILYNLFTGVWIFVGLAMVAMLIADCGSLLSGKLDNQADKCTNKIIVATIRPADSSKDHKT